MVVSVKFSPFSVNVSVNENEQISMENSKNAIIFATQT